MKYHVFPFTAIIGQDSIKKALILNAINPRIGGVLISGEKGTAKSTMVRGFADILEDMTVVDLPLNITEDRLVGSIDIEAAIAKGEAVAEPGILHKANGNILYVDEVNLLSEHITNCLLETAVSGINVIEREGISWRHESDFILVGTMNPEEGLLRPQLIDRFGLYTEARGESDTENRAEIIRRRLVFEREPVGYRQEWLEENNRQAVRIKSAKDILSGVSVSENAFNLAADISREAGCSGHRAEIVTVETARAIAALDGREEVTEDDIRKAAVFSIPHRMREMVPLAPPEPEREEEQNEINPEELPEDIPPEQQLPDDREFIPESYENDSREQPQLEQIENELPVEEDVQSPYGDYDIDITSLEFNKTLRAKGSGKRARVRSGSLQGRYVRYKFPKGTVTDLAFDATLRASAPFQKTRDKNGLAVIIKPEDLRQKIREKHTGCIVLFLVDASGSMGAKQRMGAVKGAVVSMLDDAYRKRDRVGVIAFRKDTAVSLLGITRSIDLAYKCLKDLPTGGKTPLAAGLAKAYEILKTATVREPDILPYLVLVSDGRTNVSFNGDNPLDDSLKMASRLRSEGVRSMVLDTEQGYIRLEMAKKIAEVMDAEYVKLDSINSQDIRSSVQRMIL